MTWLATIYLLTSAHGPAEIPTIQTTVPSRAPGLPSWPGGMPQAEPRDGGTYLPSPLDDEIMRRLMYLDRYPSLCQDVLNDANGFCKMRVATVEAEYSSYPYWAGLGGIVAGALIGYHVAHH